MNGISYPSEALKVIMKPLAQQTLQMAFTTLDFTQIYNGDKSLSSLSVVCACLCVCVCSVCAYMHVQCMITLLCGTIEWPEHQFTFKAMFLLLKWSHPSSHVVLMLHFASWKTGNGLRILLTHPVPTSLLLLVVLQSLSAHSPDVAMKLSGLSSGCPTPQLHQLSRSNGFAQGWMTWVGFCGQLPHLSRS